jgi:hypothetical protein
VATVNVSYGRSKDMLQKKEAVQILIALILIVSVNSKNKIMRKNP